MVLNACGLLSETNTKRKVLSECVEFFFFLSVYLKKELWWSGFIKTTTTTKPSQVGLA